ncbi:hypothetical protein [Acidithiobacillus sp. HP-11]|nr:hypothetical protein [Acidithiobacillus sp. HP-11]
MSELSFMEKLLGGMAVEWLHLGLKFHRFSARKIGMVNKNVGH